jgi:hypothetical protein
MKKTLFYALIGLWLHPLMSKLPEVHKNEREGNVRSLYKEKYLKNN